MQLHADSLITSLHNDRKLQSFFVRLYFVLQKDFFTHECFFWNIYQSLLYLSTKIHYLLWPSLHRECLETRLAEM